MFIDTHAHLYLEQFHNDRSSIISNAIDADVKKIFLPNIDSTTTKAMLALASEFSDVCFPMIGLHPCSVKENYKSEIKHITDQLSNNKFYGIGETGIDLYWDKTYIDEQTRAFDVQIQIAKDANLPIIIHSRESLDITIKLITKHQDGNLRGIFHCFNGTIAQCQQIQDIGFMMGLGGVITYKKANLGPMVANMSPDNLVLETDAPYLSPVPFRGKRNESRHIVTIAEKISEFRGESLEVIRKVTTDNAKKLFAI